MMFEHVPGVCRGVRRAGFVYLGQVLASQGHFVFDGFLDVDVQNMLYMHT